MKGDELKLAAERAAGAPASHVETVPVVETFRGQTVWQGVVEVFTAATRPPTTVYAWAVQGQSEPQFVAVLGVPPISSPLSAVRAWLVSQIRK